VFSLILLEYEIVLKCIPYLKYYFSIKYFKTNLCEFYIEFRL